MRKRFGISSSRNGCQLWLINICKEEVLKKSTTNRRNALENKTRFTATVRRVLLADLVFSIKKKIVPRLAMFNR